MEIKSNLCSNATRKIGLLIVAASQLGMDVSGYGYADENRHSGNVYLWLEDYDFTLYIALGSDDIWASWFNPEISANVDETEIEIAGKTLRDLEAWAEGLRAEAEAAE
jgi:hypothetical protein